MNYAFSTFYIFPRTFAFLTFGTVVFVLKTIPANAATIQNGINIATTVSVNVVAAIRSGGWNGKRIGAVQNTATRTHMIIMMIISTTITIMHSVRMEPIKLFSAM